MTLEQIIKDKNYIHGNKLYLQLTQIKNLDTAEELKERYEKYITNIKNIKKITCELSDEKIVEEKVRLLNEYYDIFDKEDFKKILSSYNKLRPTILKEFLYILFEDFTDNMYKNKSNIFHQPLTFIINENLENKIVNPIISIEAKTYIDKTMLEGSIATAEKIKSGNPYAKFFMVSETYEVDQSVDPAYSRIDQIYVLRKSDTRGCENPIDFEVVFSLYEDVKKHLERDWSNIKKKLTTFGKII